MDWSMPGMDGIAATREIRARCPAVAVIAYSSAADPAVREAFRAAGAVDYVDKADVDGLLSAIAAVAGASEAAPDDSHPGDPTAAPVDRFGLEVRTWRALARTTIAARGPLRRDAGATLAA